MQLDVWAGRGVHGVHGRGDQAGAAQTLRRLSPALWTHLLDICCPRPMFRSWQPPEQARPLGCTFWTSYLRLSIKPIVSFSQDQTVHHGGCWADRLTPKLLWAPLKSSCC